jgi:23S rRNA (cytosine1962-C5)-methyltransferase
MTMGDISFVLKLSSFKHVGVFPEQSENWRFIQEKIKKAGRPVSVLNLFGYTGGATLAALSAGAQVCHVDGSKTAIAWAKENAQASKLTDKKVRWMLDDALAFIKREKRRGTFYDAVIFDPPAFGRGPKGEVWKIEAKFRELVSAVSDVLSPNALFVIANGYATGYSALGYKNALEPIAKRFGGSVSCGELAIEESSAGRLLPAGIFARWSKE